MISEINILQTDLEGKKSCKVIPKEKILALKKYLSWPIMLGKKSYIVVCQEKDSNSRGLGRKKILPKPNHPYKPPPTPTPFRNQMVGPQKVTILLRPSIIATLTKKIYIYLHFILIIIRKIEESASKQAIVVLIKIRFAFTVFYFLFNKSNLFLAAFYGRSLG